MDEIVITKPEDISKLEGWIIDKAGFISGVPGIFLVLKHGASEHQIKVSLFASLETKVVSSGVTIIPAVTLNTTPMS